MKLTIQIKLLPKPVESKALLNTLEVANTAANRLSELAWEKEEFRQFPMHRLFYRQIRDEFPLSSEIVVRIIAKVSDAYKLNQDVKREFRSHGSISYDCRILSFQLNKSTVSIWTTGGRLKQIPFVCGENQRKLIELPKGESDLIFRKNKWFLNISVEVPEELEQEALDWLGIDLGLVNIAKSSDGETFGNAKKIAGIRERRWRQRKRLQSKGTRSSKKVLRRLSGRESRFIKHENHVISKQIVGVAKRTKRGIALEDLKHIRSRTRASKKQRRSLHSWAFADLGSKIAYKSRRFGVPVAFVDPHNTSRKCSACGTIDRKNRITRDNFVCKSCGFTADADTNAAENIRRAAIDRPHERQGAMGHVQL